MTYFGLPRYQVTDPDPISFIWAFQKTSWQDYDEGTDAFLQKGRRTAQYAEDIVKIYSINVTGTLGGGAAECRKCPKGVNLEILPLWTDPSAYV